MNTIFSLVYWSIFRVIGTGVGLHKLPIRVILMVNAWCFVWTSYSERPPFHYPPHRSLVQTNQMSICLSNKMNANEYWEVFHSSEWWNGVNRWSKWRRLLFSTDYSLDKSLLLSLPWSELDRRVRVHQSNSPLDFKKVSSQLETSSFRWEFATAQAEKHADEENLEEQQQQQQHKWQRKSKLISS